MHSKARRVTLYGPKKVSNCAKQQRNDLIQEIDELLNEIVITNKPQKLYKQGTTKIYGKK